MHSEFESGQEFIYFVGFMKLVSGFFKAIEEKLNQIKNYNIAYAWSTFLIFA